MTDAEYHSHPAIGREQLLLLGDSPSLFHDLRTGGIVGEEAHRILDALDPPGKKQDAFNVGEGVHRLVFEPDTVEDRFQVIDPRVLTSNGHRRGKSWENYRDHWEELGKVLVTATQMALIRAVSNAVKASMGKLLHPTAVLEEPLFWKEHVSDGEGGHHAIECRGKPDYLLARPEREFGIIIDLKTCENPADFHHHVKKWRLWMQAVHYRAGFKAKHGFYPLWYWVAVGKKPPFPVRVFQMDDQTLDAGVGRREELLEELAHRELSGDWSDPVNTTIETLRVQVA